MINDISGKLIDWYKINKRELPWRNTTNPYLIWISEIILQQTRVAQGYDYYLRFIHRFPNVESLAQASEDEVLKYWEGLGYYSRARNLHFAAKTILEKFSGVFPNNYAEILSLKGIGQYTAAAISSFAFGEVQAVVDGNVLRVLSRIFAIDTPIDSGQGKKLYQKLAEELLDNQKPGMHNQAIMEFGALQCTPRNPVCGICPLMDKCLAKANNTITKYPVKQGKAKVTERYFNYFEVRFGNMIFLQKRIENDIWKNLYEFPMIETTEDLPIEKLLQSDKFQSLFSNLTDFQIHSTPIEYKHVLSHRIIYAKFYQIELTEPLNSLKSSICIDRNNIVQYALPRLINRYLESSI